MNKEINKLNRNKIELKEMYDEEAEKKIEDFNKISSTNVTSLDKFSGATKYFYKRKISEMIKLSGIKKGDHILEIGCKDGVITFILAGMGYKITAIDLSSKCIELARKIAKVKGIKDINFLVADAEDLSQFPENCFDAVFSFSALRYVPKPQKVLTEIYRVLKENSSAVVDFPNSLCPWFKLIKVLLGIKHHIHDHTYTSWQVKEMFLSSGFRNVKNKLLLYTYKAAPLPIFLISKYIGEILEQIPVINNTAAIIMCRGSKV